MLQNVLCGKRFWQRDQRMVGGDDKDEFEPSHRLDGEQSFRRRIAGRPDHQVGAAGHQRIPASAEDLGGEFNARTRAFPVKILQKREQAFARDDVVHCDSQFGLPAGGHPLYPAFQVGGGAQQVPPLAQQFLTRVGQFRPVAAAVEQLDLQILLELLDGIGDCRGHAMQLFPGSSEAAITRNGIQHQQGIERNSHGGSSKSQL